MNIDIKELKRKILPILQRYGVEKMGLFGSCVCGEMRDGSDIDMLVEIKKDISLFDFVELKMEVEEALGKKVDLVEYNTIKPLLREKILSQEVTIL